MTNFNLEYFNSFLIGNCLNFKGKEHILSEILSNEKNLNEFSSFIQKNSHITALNLENCNSDSKKIKLLINLIINSHITDLNISNFGMNDVDAEAIAKALESNKTLINLNLQDNRIGATGAKAIANALEFNKTLISLNLKNNNIMAAGAEAIAKALEFNKTLTHLNIEHNDIETKGAEAIAKVLESNAALLSLNLKNNNIMAAGAEAIAKALEFNKTLTHLNIEHNDIETKGAEAIAKVLESNAALLSLNLKNNNIMAAGAEAIAKALEFNTTLINLNLYGNNIHDVGVEAIVKALEFNTTLTSLNLYGNRIHGAGAKEIAKALVKNCTLTSLNLGGNFIDDVGVEAIAKALEFYTTLISLEIACNEINTKGIEAIAKVLDSNITLTSVDLGTNIAVEVKEEINKKLQRNKEIKDISEAFKLIISKITIDTDGTPLLSLDKEDSEQNSCLNKLKGYSKKYGELFLPALEQSIAQSLYQDAVHVHKDGTEQLSFTARSDGLIEVTQTILKRLGFKEDKINEFNSKIVEIIREVEEMFLVELDILNNNLMNTDEIDVQTNTFDLKKPLEFLCYHEFIVGEGLKPSFDSNINVESLNDQQKVELKNNQQLTDLYEKHPELKMPGTILRDFLKSDSSIYLNTARELKQHTDEQTFKHNPQIQKLLNEFTIEFDNISAIELHESPLTPEQKEAEALLAQHSDSHLPNISEHTPIDLATDDPITPVLGDSSHHITD